MKVPFFDRTRADDAIRQDLEDAYRRVMRSGRYILGPEVEAFEREAAEYLGVEHAVAVSSGTDALIVALKALGVGQGDEVIVPAFSFVATAEAVVRVGARPVFADVEPDTLTLDVAEVQSRATPRTRAVIPVNLFGRPANARCGILTIEDSAQAFGIQQHGIMACHSFYPTKNLGGFGDGGMVTTDHPHIAHHLRQLRNHGASGRDFHTSIGGNHRLDEMQAALLRVKLRGSDCALRWRERIGWRYHTELQGLAGVTLPTWYAAPNQYVIRVKGGRRDELRRFLTECGVGTEVYYSRPLHLQPCFAYLEYERGDFPNAELAADEVLALPIFPELTGAEVLHVIESIWKWGP